MTPKAWMVFFSVLTVANFAVYAQGGSLVNAVIGLMCLVIAVAEWRSI